MATINWESDSDSEEESFTIIESTEPRKLTESEIDFILSELKFSNNHSPVQENLITIHRAKTRAKLEKVCVKPDKIQEFSMSIIYAFHSTCVATGEAVGVNTSQNMGEPTMQMTLDTFHHTGNSAKNGALGFNRVQEILNVAKVLSNPTVTAYFIDNNQSPHQLHVYTDSLAESNIDNLLKDYHVYNPEEYTMSYWQELWIELHPSFGDLSEDDWCLSLEFDLTKLYEHNISIKDLAKKLEKHYSDIRCIPSPRNIATIDVIVDCSQINFEGPKNEHLILMEIDDDATARRFYMEKLVVPNIRGMHACGVSGIEKVYMRKAKPDEIFAGFKLRPHIQERIEHDEEWIIDTDGINLKELICQPGIDTERTISNDMREIYNLFGIEAARAYIFNECANVFKSSGIEIHSAHIEVLVDHMCYTGNIRAIARFGVETAHYDPIARATFEEVMKQFSISAVFSESSDLQGISSNILLGKRPNVGTGHVKTQSINIKVKKPEPTEQYVSEDI